MSSYNLVPGSVARTAFTITLNSLSYATYVASSAVTLATLLTTPNRAPLDVIVELEVTPGTVSGNKQAKVFAQVSMDGTNYSTGPTSGGTGTDEPDLYFIGVLPLGTNATLQRKAWSLAERIGFIPYAMKLIVYNDTGVAFAGSGCAAYYTGVSGDGT